MSRFGITVEEYAAMLESQDGCCALCGKPCNTGRRLAVDHDHTTGAIRGLLCSFCNQRVLGNLTAERIEKMYIYTTDPPANKVLGGVRYVPEAYKKPKKYRKRRTLKRTSIATPRRRRSS